MNKQYKQTINVLWVASIIAQDAHGNTTERGIRVLDNSIATALEQAEIRAAEMASEEEWDRWMIYDIGIVPDDCFQ